MDLGFFGVCFFFQLPAGPSPATGRPPSPLPLDPRHSHTVSLPAGWPDAWGVRKTSPGPGPGAGGGAAAAGVHAGGGRGGGRHAGPRQRRLPPRPVRAGRRSPPPLPLPSGGVVAVAAWKRVPVCLPPSPKPQPSGSLGACWAGTRSPTVNSETPIHCVFFFFKKGEKKLQEPTKICWPKSQQTKAKKIRQRITGLVPCALGVPSIANSPPPPSSRPFPGPWRRRCRVVATAMPIPKSPPGAKSFSLPKNTSLIPDSQPHHQQKMREEQGIASLRGMENSGRPERGCQLTPPPYRVHGLDLGPTLSRTRHQGFS